MGGVKGPLPTMMNNVMNRHNGNVFYYTISVIPHKFGEKTNAASKFDQTSQGRMGFSYRLQVAK